MAISTFPGNLAPFMQKVSTPIPTIALLSAPPYRCHRRNLVPASVPHRSSCLANKAHNRLSVDVVVQNILMRKVGLVTQTHVEMTDFDQYLNLLKEGLSEEHEKMIYELFMDHPLTLNEGELV
jgi:hypothetical protein